jgi:hypothetical protein
MWKNSGRQKYLPVEDEAAGAGGANGPSERDDEIPMLREK